MYGPLPKPNQQVMTKNWQAYLVYTSLVLLLALVFSASSTAGTDASRSLNHIWRDEGSLSVAITESRSMIGNTTIADNEQVYYPVLRMTYNTMPEAFIYGHSL